MENVGLTFAQVLSKAHREGVGLRVADSYTGNHPEGGFTPFETILSAKDTIAMQRCGLSAKELNEFLSSYPIPSEYDVILPTSTQTIFYAPPGYVGLYTHSFSLANLWLPRTDFFCEGCNITTLIEMENLGLTFAQVSSKAHREGVGLRVADSHTGNHPEGGFTPFETIRRLLVVIRRRSHLGFQGETFEP
ncbi:hypothetical protein Tco_1484072 [Tanacetum coccineum]